MRGAPGPFFFLPARCGYPSRTDATTLPRLAAPALPTAKRETLRDDPRGRVTVNGTRRGTWRRTPAERRVEVSAVAAPGGGAAAGRRAGAKLPFRIVQGTPTCSSSTKPAGSDQYREPRERRPTLLAAVRAYVIARAPAPALASSTASTATRPACSCFRKRPGVPIAQEQFFHTTWNGLPRHY